MKLTEETRKELFDEIQSILPEHASFSGLPYNVIKHIERIIWDDQIIKELIHFKDSSTGLYCVDKNPADVHIDWIRENNFKL